MELIPDIKKELGTKDEFEMRDQILSKEMGTNDAPDGDPFLNTDSEQRAWDEHKDECNGCAMCEL